MADLFNPLKWFATNKNNTLDIPAGNVFEHRIGYPYLSVLLDTQPPTGDVVINENLGSGEIKIHQFKIYDDSAVVINPTFVAQDNLGSYLTTADTFGGDRDESVYVPIGYGSNHSVVAICPNANTALKKIEIGATASKPKQYIVDVKLSGDSKWTPVLYMIANQDSRDFFDYTFPDAVSVSAVRIRYKGDFYAKSNAAKLTVSGSDELSSVSKVKISRYMDFSDATEFATNIDPSATDGWLDFSDGVSIYDWELTNYEKLWKTIVSGNQGGELEILLPFGNDILAIGTYDIVKYKSDGSNEQNSFDFIGNVTSATLHNNRVYVGTDDGHVFSSSDGLNYTLETDIVSALGGVAVNAIVSYLSKLYIGSSVNSKATVYCWNTTSLTQAYKSTQKRVTCMTVTNGSLYVGMGGEKDSAQATIYRFNGINWELTLSPNADSVDVLTYSPVNSMLWAGLSGGQIVTASFSNNKPTWSTTTFYDGAANNYLFITSSPTRSLPATIDNPAKNYIWLGTDKGIFVCVDTVTKTDEDKYVDSYSFEPVVWPQTYTEGLVAVWYPTSGGSVTKTGQIINGPPDAVSYDRAVITGYIKADYSEKYTFSITANDGDVFVLTIDSNTVVDSSNGTSGTLEMVAGKWVPIYLSYECNGATVELQLSWSSTSQQTEIIPIDALSDKVTKINDMAYFGNDVYGACVDSYLYQLDTSSIATKTRKIYAKFKDEAGNETPDATAILTSGSIYDEILQDAEIASDGSHIANGFVYQLTGGQKLINTFPSPVRGALFAPSRELQVYGYYTSFPLYVSNLTRWDKIYFLCDLPATEAGSSGMQDGLSIKLYVRTAKTQADLLLADWGDPVEKSTINSTTKAGTGITGQMDISNLQGKWIQYYVVLSSASRGATPTLRNVTLSYQSSQASYFFTSMIDTSVAVEGINFITNSIFNTDTTGWLVDRASAEIIYLATGGIDNGSLKVTFNKGDIGDVAALTTSFVVPSKYSNSNKILVQFDYVTSVDYPTDALQVSVYSETNQQVYSVLTDDYIHASTEIKTFKGYFYTSDSGVDDTCILDISWNGATDDSFDCIIDNVKIAPFITVANPATFRRGLLAANTSISEGEIRYAYTTEDTFDFGKYELITPNTIFELPIMSSKIRFGLVLITTGNIPTVVHDFGVLLDAGTADLRLTQLPDAT